MTATDPLAEFRDVPVQALVCVSPAKIAAMMPPAPAVENFASGILFVIAWCVAALVLRYLIVDFLMTIERRLLG